jgi:hypothetical protein
MTSILNGSLHRLLQDEHHRRTKEGARTNDGPIGVLIVVCFLFCFIW